MITKKVDMRYDMILWYNVVQYEQVMIREPEKHQGDDNGAVHKTHPHNLFLHSLPKTYVYVVQLHV